MFEDEDDSLDSILQELKTSNPVSTVPVKQMNYEVAQFNNENELRNFILENGAKTVAATQEIIAVLLDQIQCNPDAELITSVAEMVSSNNKALETLTKLQLNAEKLKHAKELETFKQQTKLATANIQAQRPILTREELFDAIYDKKRGDN